jgi:hypothetical protein
MQEAAKEAGCSGKELKISFEQFSKIMTAQ